MSRTFRLLLAEVCLLTSAQLCAPARAGFTFLGPTPYLSAADSPFDLSGLGSTFFLEDFEDLVPQPGMSADPILMGDPILEFIRQMGNSVDADDGVIDNSGAAGFSASSIEFIDATYSTEIVRFQFDPVELGFLPTAVGFVLTLAPPGLRSQFTAFAPDGSSAFIDTNDLVLTSGTTSDDRFVGVLNPLGILQIVFTSTGIVSRGPRVDHLQYGLLVPEPDSVFVFALAFLWILHTLSRIRSASEA